MAKKRRSSQFKDSSQVIDIDEARRKRQEKRKKQQREAREQEEGRNRSVRASIKAGRRRKKALYAVIILFIIAAIGMSAMNIVKLKAEQREVKEQQQQLLEEKKQLQDQLKQADDPVYVQDAAREVLRMVNPGETIYVMDIPAQPADDKEEKTDGN